MEMLCNAEPDFSPSIKTVRNRMFCVERTLMRSTELGEVLQHNISIHTMIEEDPLIG